MRGILRALSDRNRDLVANESKRQYELSSLGVYQPIYLFTYRGTQTNGTTERLHPETTIAVLRALAKHVENSEHK